MFNGLNNNIIILIFFIILFNFYCIYEINNLKKNQCNRVENFTTQDDINTAVKKIYLADVEAIRLLSNFAIQLSQGGFTIPGAVNINGHITTAPGHIINSTGRQHISCDETLYLLPKGPDGVVISKNWTSPGRLQVSGNIDCGGTITTSAITTSGAITASGITTSGAITASAITASGAITATGAITANNTIRAIGAISTSNGHYISCDGRQHISTLTDDLYLLPKGKVVIGKEGGGTGNLSIQGDINCNGELHVNNMITTPPGHTINCTGHQHISTISGPLWLLPKDGVIIGKEWLGTGNLSVEGNLSVQGYLKIGNTVITEKHLKILTGQTQIKLKHTGGSTNYPAQAWVTVEGGGGNHIVKWDEAASAFFSLIYMD